MLQCHVDWQKRVIIFFFFFCTKSTVNPAETPTCLQFKGWDGYLLTQCNGLQVGRKRAPTFNADTRQLVYPIFERYEREKLRRNRYKHATCAVMLHHKPQGEARHLPILCRYDHMDLLFHICSSLKATGYKGTIIHNIYRDEVQDFTQAELLVDLRSVDKDHHKLALIETASM